MQTGLPVVTLPASRLSRPVCASTRSCRCPGSAQSVATRWPAAAMPAGLRHPESAARVCNRARSRWHTPDAAHPQRGANAIPSDAATQLTAGNSGLIVERSMKELQTEPKSFADIAFEAQQPYS